MTVEQPMRALITGGASGFGLAVTRALLAQGYKVAIGDIVADRLEEAAKDLDSPGLITVGMDVTSPASAAAAAETCVREFGGLDALVNSAGVITLNPLAEISEQEWDHVIDVDLKGTFLCCQAAAPLICRSPRGRIVNIGSDAAKLGIPLVPHYCAAKAGVAGLTRSLASELASHGVTVNCVCPVGVSTTTMGQELLDWKSEKSGMTSRQVLASTAADIPLKRNATEADIVNAVLFFLSEESGFLTGSSLDVDGGLLSTIPVPGGQKRELSECDQ